MAAPRGSRAGAVPALGTPPRQYGDRQGPTDSLPSAETLRLPPGHPDRAPPPADFASGEDPRLTNASVQGLRAPPTPIDLGQDAFTGDRFAGSAETVAAPGELAGILDELGQADVGLRGSLGTAAAAPDGLHRQVPPSPEMTSRLGPSNRGMSSDGQAFRATTADRNPTAVPGRGLTIGSANDRRPMSDEVRFIAAPMWRRLLATVIDGSVIAALIILPLRAGWFGTVAQNIRPWEPDDIGRALFDGHLTIPLVLTALLVLLLGSVPHGLAGRTLGKLLTGLMIVNSWTGARPGWAQVILRQLVGLLTTILGIASYFWFIVDRRNSALHDRLTGTSCVVANSRVVRAARDPVG